MDWRSVNFDWNRARAFLVTAEEGSFSAAARALETTQPTIGRQVAQLEDELGVLLFERVGTRLELTETGLALAEYAREMGEAASKLSLVATGQSMSLSGKVAITASEAIATYLMPAVVLELRKEHPNIELDIVVSNDARDLHRREADIAVRNFRTEQEGLIAKKVVDAKAYLYASPDYLDRIGPIDSPGDIVKAEIFGFDDTDLMIKGLNALGLAVTAENFPVCTANHLVQWEYCKRGIGICIMMSAVGDHEPGVVKVLPDHFIPVPIWLVSHRELRTTRRIRLVFDRLAEALSG